MNNKFSKVHPGTILLEAFLEPLGISQNRLARDLCVQPNRIHEIVQGKRPISAEIALRLAHYFGISKRFWLDLQSRYDRERERARSQSSVDSAAKQRTAKPELVVISRRDSPEHKGLRRI